MKLAKLLVLRSPYLGVLSLAFHWALLVGCSPSGSGPDDEGVSGAADASVSSETADAQTDASDALTVAKCFEDTFESGSVIRLDYDQFAPVVGTHCVGTNHQDIQDIERVVFLGDSVSAGTPPTDGSDFYRSRLADKLATRFDIEAPSDLWKSANMFGGFPLLADSGAFSACPQWGAKTNDLLDPQVERCFPASSRDARTLVVFTIGGNDVAGLTKAGSSGVAHDVLWIRVHQFVEELRNALAWFREPGRFPNGVDIVFANIFEFTDATGDTNSCPAAETAGFGDPWQDPEALAEMVIWANEQFLKAAVDYDADMMFMLETFCGHGFKHDDPSGECYRGPDAARWFDDTCMHPNPLGHEMIAEKFDQIIAE